MLGHVQPSGWFEKGKEGRKRLKGGGVRWNCPQYIMRSPISSIEGNFYWKVIRREMSSITKDCVFLCVDGGFGDVKELSSLRMKIYR